MSKVIAIASRDLTSYLNSFSFYLVLAFFTGITGYFFWSAISYFSILSFQAAATPAASGEGLNLTEVVFSPFLLNVSVLLLLFIPILTMRTFSEERKMGTLELLVTYPVTDIQIVLGKWIGMICLVLVLVIPTCSYFLLARIVQARFELVSLWTGYLGLALVGMSFISLGIFVSALTEHAAVSAGIGFALILFFWIVGWMADWASPAVGVIFRELSLIEHFRDLTRGVFDTRDILFFFLFTGFFLFATVCALEVRSWKR